MKGGHGVADAVPNQINNILKRRKEMRAYPHSLNQLAAVADVSRNTVWNLAHGMYWPKLDTAYKLARALSTTVYELWGEHEILSFLNELSEAEQDRIMREVAGEISED
jgi:DNA-binding XRE family transcriptional regulator